MLPELTFGDNVTLPAFYGKNCVTGLGLRNSFYFRYDQPELINTKEEIVKNLGSVKVQWNFSGSKISCEFAYTVKQQVTLDKFRYMITIAAPHSKYHVNGMLGLGPLGHRCTVQKDDFQGVWQETEVVSQDPTYRTNYGKRVLEPLTTNTVDQEQHVAAELRRVGGDKVILVTSPLHTRRTKSIWHAVGGDHREAIVRYDTSEPTDPAHWWRTTQDVEAVVHEVLGLVNAWLGFAAKPLD